MEKDGNQEIEEFLPGFPTVKEFSADGFKRTMIGVKAFQALPQPGPSWDLHKSYPEFSRSMKNARAKIIPLMSSILKHANIPTSDFRSRDIDEKFEFLVDSNDDMLERIGSSLDEAEGLFKRSEIVVVDQGIANTALKTPGAWGKRKMDRINAASSDNGTTQATDTSDRPKMKAMYRLRVTEKPQLKFSQPIDNSSSPFVPKLKEKPHSLKPLSILPEYTAKNEEFYGHPYTVELNKWEPHDNVLSKSSPQVPKDPKDTTVVFVSKPRELERMMRDLLDKKEIAVDLEHHSYRTYLGLTCLLQISSRETDYVIDTLSLRDQLANLNEIFADPKVLKVFHGAGSDMDWLQRDFGLYVVNMFDTFVAAKMLNLPQLSLQYLLGKYCNVNQNKTLQVADWRIRPLPAEMLEYARLDTHYLLYIYDLLKNELIESGNQRKNLLLSVYDQSKQICLKRYEKPASNAQLALRKTRRSLNNRQLYAFTELYKWRDETARDKDESLGYVLPNHMLLTISETLPKEMNGILACCDPVPPLIHSNIGKIHKIITTARELPLHQVNVQKDKVEKKAKLKNWMVAINSIHDLTSFESAANEDFVPEEEFVSKESATHVQSETWPQPWVNPENWKQYVRRKGPSLNFGRATVSKQRLALMSAEVDITTPYGRYEVSKKILDMMKDPARQKDIDMQDPIVKAVYEASLIEDTEEKLKDDGADQEQPVELAKVLDEGEFIPFNPLAQASTKKRKKKGERSEVLLGEQPMEVSQEVPVGNGLPEEEENNELQDDNANVSSSNTHSLMEGGQSQSKRSKKRKGKFLNRLKQVFGKGKGSKTAVEDVQDESVQDSQTPATEIKRMNRKQNSNFQDSNVSTPPSKRLKRDNAYSESRQNSNQNHRRRRDDNGPNKSSPNQRGFNKKLNQNKTGIFRAFGKNNRSITYK